MIQCFFVFKNISFFFFFLWKCLKFVSFETGLQKFRGRHEFRDVSRRKCGRPLRRRFIGSCGVVGANYSLRRFSSNCGFIVPSIAGNSRQAIGEHRRWGNYRGTRQRVVLQWLQVCKRRCAVRKVGSQIAADKRDLLDTFFRHLDSIHLAILTRGNARSRFRISRLVLRVRLEFFNKSVFVF